ncbi:MAG: BrnA antitoxin family protein [Acidobacteria bacterium]|nr:BrnA antitoxin family protein [Acidobacteriota bacterium]MCI0718974.1 BrnA antitoxin family protein [Acidobacteriota bacterium]
MFQPGRGPQKAPTKVSTTIRLDPDVLAWFKSQGPGYQTRINEALRSAVEQSQTSRSSGRAKKRRAG